jgi:hypothetical protein
MGYLRLRHLSLRSTLMENPIGASVFYPRTSLPLLLDHGNSIGGSSEETHFPTPATTEESATGRRAERPLVDKGRG